MKRLVLSAAALLLLSGCAQTEQGQVKTGKIEGLDKLNEIQVVSREEGSGTRSMFAELAGFQGNEQGKTDMTAADAKIAENAEQVCVFVSENESAVGYLSFGAVPEDGSVKILGINGKRPDQKEKNYPLERTFYLAYSGRLSELEDDFLTYVHGAGQEIVAEAYTPVAKSSSFLSNKEEGSITIEGSTSVAPLMEKMAETYMEINPNARIEVIESDSGAGLTRAMSGQIDLAMSSRDLKDYEMELLDYEAIARDQIAVVVNPENPLENVDTESLKQIFTGEMKKWENLNQ